MIDCSQSRTMQLSKASTPGYLCVMGFAKQVFMILKLDGEEYHDPPQVKLLGNHWMRISDKVLLHGVEGTWRGEVQLFSSKLLGNH